MKNEKFNSVLSDTGTDGRPEIRLNRGKANILRQRGKMDSQGVFSVFGQLCQRMNKAPHS
jgi:hypothetical protein